MTLETRNPLYDEFLQDWAQCRDVYRGQRVVKSKGVQYLPATSSMYKDGYPVYQTRGWYDYNGYITRARLKGHLKQAVKTFMGMLWHKEPKIELPPQMEYLFDSATRRGETLMHLYRDVNREQLIVGRLGLLADLPLGESSTTEPYIVMYQAEDITNWDEGERHELTEESLNMVVLNESGFERSAAGSSSLFEHQYELSYRVLILGDGSSNQPGGETSTYSAGVFHDQQPFTPDNMQEPSLRGNTLNEIPFVFINTQDIAAQPDDPFLLDLCNLDLSIYRKTADYHQTLYMQGQHTLVITGGDTGQTDTGEPLRTGAGALINITNPQGRAEFIGISGDGLPEQRTSLENDSREAELLSGNMTDNRTQNAESGKALETRMAGQTASLKTIAMASALGMQSVLRKIATWMGLDPLSVIVTPNIEFGVSSITAQDLVHLQAYKLAGGAIRSEDIHETSRKGGFARVDYEQTLGDISSEEPLVDLGEGLSTDADSE